MEQRKEQQRIFTRPSQARATKSTTSQASKATQAKHYELKVQVPQEWVRVVGIQ